MRVRQKVKPLVLFFDVKIAGRAWTKKVTIKEPNHIPNGARRYATDEEARRQFRSEYRRRAESATWLLNKIGFSGARIEVRS